MAFTYTVAQLKTDLENSLHGTTLNQVQGVNSLIQRAASTLLLELDPQETIRIVNLASPIFNSVYEYALPVDLKGTKIIDIRPQANRTLLDRYLQIYNQDFDLNKVYTLQPNFTLQFNQGVKNIRVDNNLIINGVQLNAADTISGNGLWVASGGATNLVQNNLQFTNGTASAISFDTTAGPTVAILTNSTMNPQDLTEQYLQAQQFLSTFLSPASKFTSIEFRFGSSAGNYYSETYTTTQAGTAFQNGWNLLSGNWANATKVGNPNISAINYLQVRWTYDGTVITDVGLNQIYSQLGVISQMEYYSKYLFQDSITGAFQETITNDSNLINLDTETRNVFFFLVGKYTVQQVQGLDALFFDSADFANNYERALSQYKAQYKSQWQKPKSSYYVMSKPSNRNWAGGRWGY